MTIIDRFQHSFGKLIESLNLQPDVRGADPVRLEEEVASLRMTNIELLETLGAVVDALNASTLNHSTQVALYSVAMARQLGLSQKDQDIIFKAALVHDVGMICVNSAALTNPGRFSPMDLEELKLHPTVGGEIVGRISHLRELAPLVHHHHERYDGNGYPDRLMGEEIPLGARIISLADGIDAMLTGRPGRAPYALPEVIYEVIYHSGTQYDPLVVKAFLALAEQRGEAFFISSNADPTQAMLLETLGISTGRAKKIIKGG